MATERKARSGAAKTTAAEVKTYVATTPILHDGEPYQPGDEIELTTAQANRLARKVAQPLPPTQQLPEIPKV